MAKLFVNVDHVATVREARKIHYPDPVVAAMIAEDAGVDGITAHLREDRRHVNDDDIRKLHARCRTPFNFELSVNEEIVALCEELAPPQATLVPERREEVTTEGGLDLDGPFARISEVTDRLRSRDVLVSLFIDPDIESIERSKEAGASHVELHTGAWAEAKTPNARAHELERLETAAARALELDLIVNAGHGLHYENTAPIAAIPGMNDLNIGHAIVAKAIEVGMDAAVRGMIAIVRGASS